MILDHGLYHQLGSSDRLGLCALILACSTPWPSSRHVRRLAAQFFPPPAGDAGDGTTTDSPNAGLEAAQTFLPALISPSFALATVRGFRDLKTLRAAARGRLPEGTTLDDIWNILVSMRSESNTAVSSSSSSSSSPASSSQSGLLGLLHSMGYIRGLQNALGLSEEDRVRALALAAVRAIWESEEMERGGGQAGRQDRRLRKKLERTAWLVKMQFLLLRAVAAVLYVIGWLLPSLR